jgi:hypothetical protein
MSSICPKNKVWDRILKKCRRPLKRGRKIIQKQNFLGGEIEMDRANYEYLAKAYTLIDDNVSDNSEEELRRKKK